MNFIMSHWLSRQELLLGTDANRAIRGAAVAVVGLGGVGGAAAEALCRTGVGKLILVDHDVFDVTNLNRQILSNQSVLGELKCAIAKERLLSINPELDCTALDLFYLPETREILFDQRPDYIIDAVDTVTAKLDLIEQAVSRKIPIVSSMGTGNRLHPESLCLGIIEDTAGCGCGLARVMRKELRSRSISGIPVVYSKEVPKNVIDPATGHGRHAPGSISFVPPVAGYLLAGKVIRDLCTIYAS